MQQFTEYLNPLIEALKGLGGSSRMGEAADKIAEDLKLSDDVLNEQLPSGRESRFENQVRWARYYLAQDGYLSCC